VEWRNGALQRTTFPEKNPRKIFPPKDLEGKVRPEERPQEIFAILRMAMISDTRPEIIRGAKMIFGKP
jgi:hypothetical protein